jgi:CxxC motif-containing protein
MVQEIICIVCPRGCHLKVDPENDYEVTGNACPRGIPYGKAELKNPTRVITSTVKIKGADLTRCPVKTDQPISKAKMYEVMKMINAVTLEAPVKVGDVIIERILNTDANLVVCRDID